MDENTFAEQPEAYARARPRYPAALIEWLASRAPALDAVWDCATGSGQAAVGLARHFRKIYATDVSAEQIAHATPLPSIEYQIAPAEASRLEDSSVDAIAVAQALHWFDHGQFWAEVSRVARPGALFCAWGYSWMSCSEVVDDLLIRPFRELLLPFWAPQNRVLWDGYRRADIELPYEPIECPEFEIEVEWTVEQIIAYMGTWSAFKLSRSDPDAASAARRAIEKVRSAVHLDELHHVRMPLAIVAAYIPDRR